METKFEKIQLAIFTGLIGRFGMPSGTRRASYDACYMHWERSADFARDIARRDAEKEIASMNDPGSVPHRTLEVDGDKSYPPIEIPPDGMEGAHVPPDAYSTAQSRERQRDLAREARKKELDDYASIQRDAHKVATPSSPEKKTKPKEAAV